MPGADPMTATQSTSEATSYTDPATDLADYGSLPPSSPGSLMLQGPRAAAFHPQAPAKTRTVAVLPPPAGRPGNLVKLPGGKYGVTRSGLPQAMPHLATVPPAAPNYDPPQGSSVLLGQPDGSIVVLPLPSGYQPSDDAGPINTALLQARGTGQTDAFLGGSGQTSGRVTLASGAVYNVQSTIVVPPGCELWMGRNTVLKFSGTGPCISTHGAQAGGANIQGVGTKIVGGVIDLSNCPPSAQASGVEFGDQYSIVLEDITVNNNVTTGSTNSLGLYPVGAVGFNWANLATLTEKLYMRRCTVNNCGTPNFGGGSVVPSQGGGAALQIYSAAAATNTSHQYSEIDLHINQQPGQNAIVIARQGHLMNGRLILRGNMNCPGSGPNNCAVIVLGVSGGAGAQAGHIQRMYMDIHVESDPPGGGNLQPFTIYAGGNADNTVNKCHGRIQMIDGFQNTNLGTANGTFEFSGPIIGPTDLANLMPNLGTISTGVQIIYNGTDALLSYSSSGAISSVVLNGVTLFPAAGPGSFPIGAGNTVTFTFAGVMSYSLARIGQGP